jgi:secreted PhoX family phosphatase
MKTTQESRRSFLKLAAVTGGVLVLQRLGLRPAGAGTTPMLGKLVPTAAENTGEYLLTLPEGFHYNVLLRRGDTMSDGRPSPGSADGMAAFDYNGKIRLVRNHERGTGPAIGNTALAYDGGAAGGTTTLTVDPEARLLMESFISLSGTRNNCAGGATPWGTWLSCEETNCYIQKQHGHIFEVAAKASGQVPAVPLKNMGLLYPEAVAIDPETGIAYITMDRNPGGIFRFIPDQYGVLSGPGTLQMLALDGLPRYDTRTGQQRKVKIPVTWVNITTPTPEAAYRSDSRVAYREGLALGGATFARPEGMWHSRNSVFFSCTSGGDKLLGQIWELHLQKINQSLEIIYESADASQLDSPDNICVTPSGNNLIVCEDGSGGEYLHLLRRDGNQISRLAQNIVPGFEHSEWAGACFSPDGKTLFANLYGPSMTFAIWTDHWRTIDS